VSFEKYYDCLIENIPNIKNLIYKNYFKEFKTNKKGPNKLRPLNYLRIRISP